MRCRSSARFRQTVNSHLGKLRENLGRRLIAQAGKGILHQIAAAFGIAHQPGSIRKQRPFKTCLDVANPLPVDGRSFQHQCPFGIWLYQYDAREVRVLEGKIKS